MAPPPASRLSSRRWSPRRWCRLAVLALCSCQPAAETQPPAATATAAAPPASAPARSAAPQVDDAERTLSGQAEWTQAELGDALDQARVARSEGALRLLAEVRARSPRAAFALKLLPLAPDAEVELGSACALLRTASGDDRSALLGALAGVLARGATNTERPNVAELRECASVLRGLRGSARGQDADHIASALEQLRQREVKPD